MVLVGQCGVQLGAAILKSLRACALTATRAGSDEYFTPDGYLRCVLIDTEPKAVDRVRSSRALGGGAQSPSKQQKQPAERGGILRPCNMVLDASGRGNNWAHGFFFHRRRVLAEERMPSQIAPATITNGRSAASSSPSPSRESYRPSWCSSTASRSHSSYGSEDVLRQALHAIHAELRRAGPHVESILVVHSVAGGTGSGLGSRLMQLLGQYYISRTPRAGEADDDATTHEAQPPLPEDDSLWEGIIGDRCTARRLVALAVLPCPGTCEVNVQYINMALSLGFNAQHCDVVLLIENSYNDQLCDFAALNETLADFLVHHSNVFGPMGIEGFLRSRFGNDASCHDPNACTFLLLTGQKGYRYFSSGTHRPSHPDGNFTSSRHLSVATTPYALLNATPEIMTKLLRPMFEDVVRKLDAQAYVWQYMQYEGMSYSLLLDVLHLLRSFCVSEKNPVPSKTKGKSQRQ